MEKESSYYILIIDSDHSVDNKLHTIEKTIKFYLQQKDNIVFINGDSNVEILEKLNTFLNNPYNDQLFGCLIIQLNLSQLNEGDVFTKQKDYALFQRIKNLERLKTTPILVITPSFKVYRSNEINHTACDDIKQTRALELGADDVLFLPYMPIVLDKKIKTFGELSLLRKEKGELI